MKPLHGFDASTQLNPYVEHPGLFHVLGYRPTSGAAFFAKRPPVNKLILSHNKTLSVANLDVYDIRAGDVGGLSVGFLFHSPLALRGDFFYLMFYRRSVNTQRDLIDAPLTKRFVSDDLVIHSNAMTHYIVLRGKDNATTRFISKV